MQKIYCSYLDEPNLITHALVRVDWNETVCDANGGNQTNVTQYSANENCVYAFNEVFQQLICLESGIVGELCSPQPLHGEIG